MTDDAADPDDPEEPAPDEPADPRPDGGTAAGADEMVLDPWGSATIEDYGELFDQFGIEAFDEVLGEVPNPHYLMRRGIIFGHRDYRALVDAMRNDEPVAALSGFMPTGDPHVGHKMVFDELVWHQEQGADTYGLIADLEAHSARGLSWDEIDEHARDYLLSLLALGFDPEAGELYRQSENRVVQDLAFELGIEANFSEMQAIYGFDRETDVSHLQSVITQAADILYPQLEEPKPTIIPVGPDQDPHLRLTRDLATRMRYIQVVPAYSGADYDPNTELSIVAELYDTLEKSIEDGLDMETTDIRGGVFGNIRGRHAHLILENINESNVSLDNFQYDINNLANELADIYDDFNSAEWSEIISEHEQYVTKFHDYLGSDVVDSTLKKLYNAGKEPLRPRVRFVIRRGSDEFREELKDDLVNRLSGEIRVHEGILSKTDQETERKEEHIESFKLINNSGHPDTARAEEIAREVEVDHGGYGFCLPSSLYHRFMTGLTGGKMSSSVPASHISLLDDPEVGYQKVKDATTGGRETAELQRELGGEADECPVYELYAYLLAGDDDEYATRVYEECYGGERLCGECKEEAAELMREFLAEHQEKREEVEPLLESLDVELDSPRKR